MMTTSRRRVLVAAGALPVGLLCLDPARVMSSQPPAVRIVGQESLPVRISSAEWEGPTTLKVRVTRDTVQPIYEVTVSAIVMRPDGYVAGSQVQRLNPVGGRIDVGDGAVGVISLGAFTLSEGASVQLALHRIVAATGTWTRGDGPLLVGDTVGQVGAKPAGYPLVRREGGDVTVAGQGCGAAWCAAEREACKQLCGGAKGVQSFTCHAQECYSQCVCQW